MYQKETTSKSDIRVSKYHARGLGCKLEGTATAVDASEHFVGTRRRINTKADIIQT